MVTRPRTGCAAQLFSYALLKGLPYTVVCYFLSGMTINAADLFYFAAVMTLLSTIGSAIALLLVSLVPSLEGYGVAARHGRPPPLVLTHQDRTERARARSPRGPVTARRLPTAR